MKKFTYLCLLGMLILPLQQMRAQDKPQEKPKTEERAKPSIPVKVQIVFTEYDGGKKISSMPYTLFLSAEHEGKPEQGASIRTGIRIPIEVDGKNAKTMYVDIGSNIDCRVHVDDEGLFHASLTVDRSELVPNKSPEGQQLVPVPDGQPIIKQLRANYDLVLKDGETSESKSILSTDPTNGHTKRVSVTINAQK